MKKKIKIGFIGLAMLALTVSAFQSSKSESLSLNNGIAEFLKLNDAQAEYLGGCPNGCLVGSGHCWCYTYYPYPENN